MFKPHDLDELHYLEADPWKKNLATDTAHQAVLQEMEAGILGWNDAAGDMFQ